MRITRLFLLIIGIIISNHLKAQDRTVSGIVRDMADETPLIGVNILVKGTAKGTITDINGAYTLEVASQEDILVFSYMGYISEEYQVGDRSVIDVALAPELTQLEELIVIGYGVTKKSVVTGAIAKVDDEDITRVATPRIDQAIQGQVAGVQISQNSGQPGADQTVVIRGVGTNGNSKPIYIIDGLPTDDMSHINPMDVASIEILKDAASAAIYGARGANGVILITTKKGEKGRTSLSYDGYYGVQQAWKVPELLNSEQYVELMNERVENERQTPSPNLPAVGDPLPYETNWLNEIFKTAPIQEHQISVTSGGENSTFLASGSYFDQQGIIGKEKARFTRYTLRLNSTIKIKDFIEFGNNLSYIHVDKANISQNDIFSTPLADAYNLDPLFPIEDPARDRGWGQSNLVNNELINPFSRFDITNSTTTQDKLLGNLYLDFELLEGLKFRTDFGAELFFTSDDNFKPTYDFTNNVFNNVNEVSQGNYRKFLWQWENTLVYSKTIGRHNFSALIGTTALKDKDQWGGASVSGIPREQENNPYWWYIDSGVDSTENAWGSANIEHSLVSYFGRATYDYDQKYLFSFIFRRDGSSNFGPENKFANFPSVSAGWVISRENFWNIPQIDFLKVRASWGRNGNEAIPGLQYTSIITREFRTYEFGKPGSEAKYQGASPAVLSNPSVQWETSEQTNIGVDVGIFNSKVNVALDFYRKDTKGLLMEPIIEVTRGNDPANVNVGSVRNSGLEIELSYNEQFGAVDFFSSFNATYLKNEVTNVSNEDGFLQGYFWPTKNVEITRMQEGLPIGFFLGYKTAGIFQDEDEILYDWINDEAEPLQPRAKPGDQKIVDVNQDGVIDANDKTMIGNPWPKWMFGGSVGAKYKGFDISLLFNASVGNDIYKIYKRQDLPYANLDAWWIGRWTEENPSNTIPRLKSSYPESDFFVESGNFLRIRNLTLGYTLPLAAVEKAKISNLRIYLAVDNLATLTNYTGFDPEIGSNDGWILRTGIDQGFYPQPRTSRIGLNLTF
jgi:TonB-linked SusC/RagA family outer membrane protein